MPESEALPTTCGECGEVLPDEVPGTAPDDRVPCPNCRSTRRTFGKTMTAEVKAHAQLGFKAKTPGEKKPFIEGKIGEDLHRDSGEFRDLDRRLDRRKDQYDERITDQKTGEVIREVHEPLSEHVGRGSAKHKKKPDSGK